MRDRNPLVSRLVLVAIVLGVGAFTFTFCGCQGLPGGSQSPGTAGAPAVATGVQAAQTIGGDQGQAQTPQTVTTGTATQNWFFASQVMAEIQAAILAMAAEKDWTAAQTVDALKATNGAPENVTITTADVNIQSGAGDQAGASGGTGGNNQTPPTPKAP